MQAGIYMINNKINNCKYIGQTKDISTRWIKHKCALKGNRHTCEKLQKAWKEYGEENFVYSIIEIVEKDKLNEREKYWIEYYDSKNNGYNIAAGGAGCEGFKHRPDELKRMRSVQKPDAVIQFDLNHNIIREWDGGIIHASKALRYTKECIALRCKHTISKMTPYKNSYWVYKEEFNNPDFTWEGYMNNVSLFDYKKSKPRQKKKVYQYSIDKKLIKIWDCLADVRKAYGSTSSVSAVLNKSRGKRSAYGYIWAYEECDFSDGYFDVLLKYKNKANEKRKRKVAKIEPNTFKCIGMYDSLTEAGNAHNADCSQITKAAKNYPKCTSCGYLWKYL